MKKVCRYLKLRKLKTDVQKESWERIEGKTFVIIFSDGSSESYITKTDLYNYLEKDHIRPIRYIFDITDRIIIDRNIIIDTEDI